MIERIELKKAKLDFKADSTIGSEPFCPCGKKSNLTTGREIYPHLKYLYKKHFYICRPCKAYVGCHPGSTNPLGVIANKDHRDAKVKAHKAFDTIWQSGRMLRTNAYSWLADQMGMRKKDCHIGQFSIENCNRVAELSTNYLNANALKPQLIPATHVIIRRSMDGSEIRRVVSTVETVRS